MVRHRSKETGWAGKGFNGASAEVAICSGEIWVPLAHILAPLFSRNVALQRWHLTRPLTASTVVSRGGSRPESSREFLKHIKRSRCHPFMRHFSYKHSRAKESLDSVLITKEKYWSTDRKITWFELYFSEFGNRYCNNISDVIASARTRNSPKTCASFSLLPLKIKN